MMRAPGRDWVADFPTSTSLDALVDPFRGGATAFLESLTNAGAQCHVSATFRPPERAYLMHWACMVALSGQDPAGVPAMDGVDIDWTAGGDADLAKHGAAEMIKAYGIAFPAALVSRHTQGRAIDVTIVIPSRPAKLLQFKAADGRTWKFGAGDDASLHRFGATFGVIKLLSDPPHWSDDGR